MLELLSQDYPPTTRQIQSSSAVSSGSLWLKLPVLLQHEVHAHVFAAREMPGQPGDRIEATQHLPQLRVRQTITNRILLALDTETRCDVPIIQWSDRGGVDARMLGQEPGGDLHAFFLSLLPQALSLNEVEAASG